LLFFSLTDNSFLPYIFSLDVTDDSAQSCKPGCLEVSSSQEVVESILAALIQDAVQEASTLSAPPRRQRKKKERREHERCSSDSDQWDRLKECGVAGWKRILARNCDSDGGWGFNFVRQEH
jgi:hypothetical protein